jgi:type II secretory pathway pseudopilin PulG
MKLSLHKLSECAFTLAEMGVAVGVAGLLGLAFFQVLQSGLTLAAKNTAVNSAHEEARQGVLRLTRDVHASISVPQLRDSSFAVISSTPVPGSSTPIAPTAAGVSFQNIASGPNYIWKDPGNPSLIMIRDNPKPIEGQRVIIPFWGIEDDIAKVTAGGSANHSNVFTVHALETNINGAPGFMNGTTYAITYYTDRVMYVVENGTYVADAQGDLALSGGVYTSVTPGTGQYHYEKGELNLYKQRYSNNALIWQKMATVARYISSPKPFCVPLNRSGSSNNKYVGITLSARDPKSSNRGYIATASLLNTQVDYRSRLTTAQ